VEAEEAIPQRISIESQNKKDWEASTASTFALYPPPPPPFILYLKNPLLATFYIHTYMHTHTHTHNIYTHTHTHTIYIYIYADTATHVDKQRNEAEVHTSHELETALEHSPAEIARKEAAREAATAAKQAYKNSQKSVSYHIYPIQALFVLTFENLCLTSEP